MAVAPTGACNPPETVLMWPASITIVLSPSILPAAESSKWPQSNAVTAGAAGASAAAEARPADRRAVIATVVRFLGDEMRIVEGCPIFEGCEFGAQHCSTGTDLDQSVIAAIASPMASDAVSPGESRPKRLMSPVTPCCCGAENRKSPATSPS